jgi:Zn-dependent M16 (insulinase) family peptidase
MSEIPYVIICRGCKEEDAENLKHLIHSTLEKIAQDGIDKRLVDAAIHQLEFSRLEITGDANPFGLTLFMRSALAKQHGCPPENALTVHALFEKLQKNTQDPNYFPNLIKKYFLENTHFVQTIMVWRG